MGKTRWERGAQALLETLTAAEGLLGSSAIRPLKEPGDRERERERGGRARGEGREGGGHETGKRRTNEGGNSRRHGKLPDERSESYEIWPPCGGARSCSALLLNGWRSAREEERVPR
jgi:hypothetical protein